MKIFQKDFYNKISFEKDIAIHRKKLNKSIHMFELYNSNS